MTQVPNSQNIPIKLSASCLKTTQQYQDRSQNFNKKMKELIFNNYVRIIIFEYMLILFIFTMFPIFKSYFNTF